LPEPNGETFSLPALDLDLRDAVMRLAPPYGSMGTGGEGFRIAAGRFSGVRPAQRISAGWTAVSGSTGWN